MKVSYRREAVDVIAFQEQRVRHHLPDPGEPDQALRGRRREECDECARDRKVRLKLTGFSTFQSTRAP